jgi:hypothetical protein
VRVKTLMKFLGLNTHGSFRISGKWLHITLKNKCTVDPRGTTGLTYEQLGLRPKILVLTYDQSLEL